MKQFILLAGIILFAQYSRAQQYQPVTIEKGTVLHYTIYPPGLAVNYSFTVDSSSANYLLLSWMSESGRVGQFVMHEQSLQKASRGYWSPPQADVAQKMEDDRVVLIFSKELWNKLRQNRKVEFDDVLYTLKPSSATEQIIINNKPVDALYIESEQGNGIWILNNPSFPLILKIKNNPAGVDVVITGIK